MNPDLLEKILEIRSHDEIYDADLFAAAQALKEAWKENEELRKARDLWHSQALKYLKDRADRDGTIAGLHDSLAQMEKERDHYRAENRRLRDGRDARRDYLAKVTETISQAVKTLKEDRDG